MRLYLEVQKDIDNYCKKLESRGIKFDKPLKLMDWGWKHAYLKDPDGHAISLFYAGKERLGKTRVI